MPATVLRILAYVYWVVFCQCFRGFPYVPSPGDGALGPKAHTCLSAALSGLQDPVWLWAFVDRGRGGAGGGIRGEDMCSSAAQCHALKSHYLRIFGQSGPDICLANPFFRLCPSPAVGTTRVQPGRVALRCFNGHVRLGSPQDLQDGGKTLKTFRLFPKWPG